MKLAAVVCALIVVVACAWATVRFWRGSVLRALVTLPPEMSGAAKEVSLRDVRDPLVKEVMERLQANDYHRADVSLAAVRPGYVPIGAIWFDGKKATVVFRGVSGADEMHASTECGAVAGIVADGDVRVHAGFLRVFEVFAARACDALRRHQPDELVIGGFSIGAALAQLLLARLLDGAPPPPPRVSVCAVAPPRVGNRAFARLLGRARARLVLVVNVEDTVPMLPLSSRGFVHAPHAEVLAFLGFADSERDSHQMATYFRAAASGALTELRRPPSAG